MSHNNAATFADVLATIPHNLGEVPKDSMVLALVKNGSIIANLVFVMPDRDMTPSDVMLVVQKCQAVDFSHFFAVAYSDRPSKCDDHPTGYHQSQMIGLLMRMMNGAIIIGGGLVTKDHFIDFEEDEFPHHPISEIAESPTALHLAVEHSHEGAAMKVLVPEPDPSLATKLSALSIDQYVKNHGGGQMEDFAAIIGHPHYSEARETWERCLSRDFGPTKTEAINLLGYMQLDGLRDRLIVDLLSHTEDEGTFVQILKGEYDIHYSRSRMQNASSLILNLMQYAKPRHRVALFVALAIIDYLRGSNLSALEYLDAIPEDKRPDEYHALYTHMTHGGMSVSASNAPLD